MLGRSLSSLHVGQQGKSTLSYVGLPYTTWKYLANKMLEDISDNFVYVSEL